MSRIALFAWAGLVVLTAGCGGQKKPTATATTPEGRQQYRSDMQSKMMEGMKQGMQPGQEQMKNMRNMPGMPANPQQKMQEMMQNKGTPATQ